MRNVGDVGQIDVCLGTRRFGLPVVFYVNLCYNVVLTMILAARLVWGNFECTEVESTNGR